LWTNYSIICENESYAKFVPYFFIDPILRIFNEHVDLITANPEVCTNFFYGKPPCQKSGLDTEIGIPVIILAQMTIF